MDSFKLLQQLPYIGVFFSEMTTEILLPVKHLKITHSFNLPT